MLRKLWIDTRGEPVITTAPNGERNARRWGWVEAEVIPKGDLTACPTNPKVDALRDFFLAELGLWRDLETGALVVTNTWDGTRATVIYRGDTLTGTPTLEASGTPTCGLTGLFEDDAVARWRATLTPPPREPQPGEVWRLTFQEGQERNALVSCVDCMTAFQWDGDWHPVDGWPADRRRLLVEADGTVVTEDE